MLKPITYFEHAQDVIAKAVALDDSGHAICLIVSIALQGGSARELGSLAVVSDQGEMWGYLSNGCIDRDIQLRAGQALASGKPKVVRYGQGGTALDLQLPCGGSLSVALIPAPDIAQLTHVLTKLQDRRPATLSFAETDLFHEFAFSYAPKPVLALAGRGAVFRAMAAAADAAGFETRLFSPEEEDLQETRSYSRIAPHQLTSPAAQPPLHLDEHSAFLTLFHDHDWEPTLLASAVNSEARFIGCLGSRKTHALRLAALQEMGVNPDNLARIHGPIGFVPSLRHAPSIAISAMAEVIAAFPSFISAAITPIEKGR